MEEKIQPEQHTIGQSLLLHLLPGALITADYFILSGPVQRYGFPSMMALTLPNVFIVNMT